jgi:hypothetical protein
MSFYRKGTKLAATQSNDYEKKADSTTRQGRKKKFRPKLSALHEYVDHTHQPHNGGVDSASRHAALSQGELHQF